MSRIWTPPRVSDEHRESTKEFNQRLMQMFEFDSPVCQKWQPVLRSIDPLLRLGKARERAHALGVIPGFWHLLRLNDTAPYTAMPLHVNGMFVEPSEAMLEHLRRQDLQNHQVIREQREKRERAEREKAAEKAREDAERLEEMQDRWDAVTKVTVSMNRDTPWAQNHAGTKRRDRKK